MLVYEDDEDFEEDEVGVRPRAPGAVGASRNPCCSPGCRVNNPNDLVRCMECGHPSCRGHAQGGDLPDDPAGHWRRPHCFVEEVDRQGAGEDVLMEGTRVEATPVFSSALSAAAVPGAAARSAYPVLEALDREKEETWGDRMAGRLSKRSGSHHPIHNRGPLAYSNAAAKAVSAGWREKHPRILVHSVADTTATPSYFPAYRKFLSFLEDEEIPLWDVNNHGEVDEALVLFCEKMCFYEGKSHDTGKDARSCHTYLYPNAKGHLPLSSRALHSWEKLQGGELERECLCWEMVALQIEEVGRQDARMGYCSWAQADTLMREQDVEVLRWEDVVCASATEVALMLSPLDRGETTKTGPSQGVTILDKRLAEWFWREKEQHAGHDRVFPAPLPRYRRVWKAGLRKYQMEELGGPHLMRH